MDIAKYSRRCKNLATWVKSYDHFYLKRKGRLDGLCKEYLSFNIVIVLWPRDDAVLVRMGNCFGKKERRGLGQAQSRERERTQVEITTTEDGRTVLRLSAKRRKTVGRTSNKRQGIINLHVDNAARTGACALPDLLLVEVNVNPSQ